MSQLAIKGHPKRGEKVIQLLKMLGGKSHGNMNGYNDDLYYYIAKDDEIYGVGIEYEELICNYTKFTLEEFEEKFPYKVGDDVIAYAEGCLAKFTIQDIRWNYELNKVEYKICSSWIDASLIMQCYKEETMDEEAKITITPQYHCNKDKIELEVKNGYEIKCENGKYYIVKNKPQYPKDYEECCDVLGKTKAYQSVSGYKTELLEDFQELLICRDAYWEIYGKQIGLNKPWEPDWKDNFQKKWTISFYQGEIHLTTGPNVHRILAFPTVEMRDAFYENFEELIEQCKELL